MTPLQLPTDNLYKFCALSGLVMVILSVYTPMKNLYEIGLQEIEIDYRLKLISLKSDDTQIRAEEGLIDETEARLQASERLQELAEIYYLNHKAEALLTQTGYLINVFFYGIGMGFILSTFGFYCWYFRIQKPADERVRAGIKGHP